ncbi:MAG: Co2+/Mg2+ efflux protein ApaG [Nannocystaceae bacterium]
MTASSEACTRGLKVRVEARYVEDQSAPVEQRWVFAYLVTLINEGDIPTQLIARRWIITNADGETQTVEGPGVIGEQPRLEPGESFTYTSGCPLNTSIGSMRGAFIMRDDDGTSWEAEVGVFTLSTPFALN